MLDFYQNSKITSNSTFEAASNAWYESHKHTVGNSTNLMYKSFISILNKRIGTILLADLDYSIIQQVFNDLAESKYSKRTIKGVKNLLHQVLMFCEFNDIKIKNFLPFIKIPKYAYTVARQCLTDRELEIIKGFVHPARDFILFLYYTGLRKGEALALTWDDIDFSERIIIVNKSVEYIRNQPHMKPFPKTLSSIRQVYMPDVLCDLLLHLLKNEKSNFIFTASNNLPFTQTRYKKFWDGWWNDLNKSLGGTKENPAIRRITAHQLRHTYATKLFEGEVSDLAIQYLMGHSSVNTTRSIYTHLRDVRFKKEYQKIGDCF